MNISQISCKHIRKSNITFRSNNSEITPDNLDDFLLNNKPVLKQSYQDLIELRQSEFRDEHNKFTLKRTLNAENETLTELFEDFKKLFDDSYICQKIKNSQSKEYLGLINKIADESEQNKIDYKKEVSYFAKDVQNSKFVNTIEVPKISSNVVEANLAHNVINDVKKIFFTFKDSDTPLIKESNKAFTDITKNYLQYYSDSTKSIKAMHKGSEKWLERIPGVGLSARVNRVAQQQECAKYVYETHNAYCNKYIHNGIRPIALAYKEKVVQTENYINWASPHLSYKENEYVNTALSNMKKLAKPHLERYMQIISTISQKSEIIASFCKAINNNGDISSISKAIRTIAFLGF